MSTLTQRVTRCRKRGQSGFEYLLLISGGVLFVILAVTVVRTSINTNANAANNTAGGYQDYLVWQGATIGPDAVSGCVARWAFESDSSLGENTTNIVDVQRGYTNLTVSDATTAYSNASGKFGSQFQFVSNSGDANSTNTTGWSNGSVWTVTFWITLNTSSQRSAIFSSSTLNLRFHHESSGALHVISQYSPTTNTQSTAGLVPGTRYHVAIERGNDYVNIYINGRLDGSTTNAGLGGFGSAPATAAMLGNNGINPSFNGTIDELAVYNRSLSWGEIVNLYRSGSAGCG